MANLSRAPGFLEALMSQVGRRAVSNRAKRGLYASRDVNFGNMVSHSNVKTRRMFKPNVQSKRVWSDVLQTMVPFNLTTTALRMIDRAGGLDNYLLNTSDAKLDSESGIKVKRQIENKLRVQQWERERAQEERQRAAAEGGAATELPDFLKKQPEHHQCDHKH